MKAFVLFFSNKKGFGFLRTLPPDEKLGDVFVHQTYIAMDGYRTLEKNQRVEFEMGSHDGRPCAVAVRVIDASSCTVGVASAQVPEAGSVSNGKN